MDAALWQAGELTSDSPSIKFLQTAAAEFEVSTPLQWLLVKHRKGKHHSFAFHVFAERVMQRLLVFLVCGGAHGFKLLETWSPVSMAHTSVDVHSSAHPGPSGRVITGADK